MAGTAEAEADRREQGNVMENVADTLGIRGEVKAEASEVTEAPEVSEAPKVREVGPFNKDLRRYNRRL